MAAKRSEYVVVVPQKHIKGAKSRLSSVLTSEARRELILSLLRRTLATCSALRDKSGFFLCGPEAFADLAAEFGATLIPGGQGGMRRELLLMAEDWRVFGKAAMLIVSSDMPLLTIEDLEAVVSAWRACADVVICPDRNRRGTNVMMVNDPEHFRYAFGDVVGPGSFQMHLAQAQGTGLSATVVDNPRLALDLDLPQDLAAFIAVAPDDPIARKAKIGFHECFRFE
jgi:2-phospho-L-lactate guanylyltransferase